MYKRITAMLLTIAMMISMFAVPISAASSLEDAMRDVDVYARSEELSYLTMNGQIKTQHYTYVRFVP